jgi:isopenicillin N synthase-like dioxygenase
MATSDLSVIPCIDISSLFTETLDSNNDTIKQIYNSLSNQGFFYITNHGLSTEELQFILSQSKSFFEIPEEEKKRIARKDNVGSNGYVAIGVENLDDKQPGSIDYKEAMDICVSDPHPLYASNQWPDEAHLPGWRKNVEEFTKKLQRIGDTLLKAFSIAMGENEDFFLANYYENQSSVVRFLRYPPRHETALGCGAHSDYGILTLLLQDEIGGLQIQYKDKWIEVPPVKDSFVINVGDSVEFLTNGKFKATKHRVINNSTSKERYVVALFHEPNIDFKLETLSAFKQYPDPFPNRPALYGQHLSSRLSSTYTVEQ